ncbi:MAG TPA: SusC/RagA family TonB-linked outer membrane protein, partial [Hanamia sp.]|nr:SusC/RagA family TonB-linked outer membrane protein [Hanamia sp.]
MRNNKYPVMTKEIFITAFFILISFLPSFAQQKTITGNVTNLTTGEPVVGVTVSVKGSDEATQTNSKGDFSIAVSSSVQTLIFSSVGYETKEVDLNGRTSVNVELQITNSKLNEVVVIGYGSQKRKDLTGAVSSVGAETIEKVPVTTLDQALQGRAAGVQVTNNDGAPGGNMTVLIRGVGSLASYGNGPLYVVDGYPVSSGINNINPDDIESIQVLKDASATAIYGIRAANGVVLVTTKKGKKGKTQISINAYNAFQSRPKMYDVLNANQWATLANEVADADSQHNFNELPIWRTPSALTDIDWQDALYRQGLTQNYTVAIRGGSDKVQASTSVGYYNQKGIVLGSYFKRFTLGLNLDYTPTSWLHSSTSARYAYENSNTPFGTNNLTQLTELPPTMDSGNKFTSLIKDANGNYGFYNPKNTYVAKYGNPVYNIENNQYRNISNYFLGSSSLEATIFSGLKIKTNAGVN